MKNRIISFFITDNTDISSYDKSFAYFKQLAIEFDKNIELLKFKALKVHICYEGDINKLIYNRSSELKFAVGTVNNLDLPRNLSEETNIKDRYLTIELCENRIKIANDYVGSIPVYFSMRDHISLSNIEPVVTLDSKTSYEDISELSLYGFLRYSHFIWDETLYRHIFTQEPDSCYNYTIGSREPETKYLARLKPKDTLCRASDRDVSDALYELNNRLVADSLADEDEVILPLSAGYDSRMILVAAASSPIIRSRLKCFTYGPRGSIEVESARRLCSAYGLCWRHIDLPCHFLEPKYLKQIGMIFGSSLHFHGMYQLEFWEQIKQYIGQKQAVLTSGFMTGVPAGQHISLLGLQGSAASLSQAMNNFSQSKAWTHDILKQKSCRFRDDMISAVEARFKKAFDRFDGEVYQKAIVFDLWTRQRNFISYHPRTLEWKVPFVSPHMTPEYQNFFLSLSERHLTDRKAVELMFKYHFPAASRIAANSNGVKALSSLVETAGFIGAHVLKRLHMTNLVPATYRNLPLDFDLPALRNSKRSGLYPMFDLAPEPHYHLMSYFSDQCIESLYEAAFSGNIRAYEQLASVQALAYGLNVIGGSR